MIRMTEKANGVQEHSPGLGCGQMVHSSFFREEAEATFASFTGYRADRTILSALDSADESKRRCNADGNRAKRCVIQRSQIL
jgi:hypothetical protein